METTTNKAAPETLTVHIKDKDGVRRYPLAQHADRDMEPVAFLRARAEGYFRGHARTDFRASITDATGEIVARAKIVDTARWHAFGRTCIEAW